MKLNFDKITPLAIFKSKGTSEHTWTPGIVKNLFVIFFETIIST